MERVLYLGGAVVEPKGIIRHIFPKIDISKINKLDKPTIRLLAIPDYLFLKIN